MTTLNARQALTQVETVVNALSGMQTVAIGVPASLSNQVGAYLALIGGPADDVAAGGLFAADRRVRVTFNYRTDGDVRTAELALADLYDAFIRAFHSARAGGNLPPNSKLDGSIAGAVEYQPIAGQEFRRLPIDVVFTDFEQLS